jgi:hypothetical protein
VGLVIGHVSPEAALGRRADRGRRHDRRGRQRRHLDCAELETRRHSRTGGRAGRARPSATAAPTRWSGWPTPGCCGGCAPARCPRCAAPACRRPRPAAPGNRAAMA